MMIKDDPMVYMPTYKERKLAREAKEKAEREAAEAAEAAAAAENGSEAKVDADGGTTITEAAQTQTVDDVEVAAPTEPDRAGATLSDAGTDEVSKINLQVFTEGEE